MLKPNYIYQLGEAVAARLDPFSNDWEKAAEIFGVVFLAEEAETPEEVLKLFSEWIIFEHTSPAFGGRTGLEYFLQENPLKLSEKDLHEYESLRENIFGLFEVVRIERGRGVEIESVFLQQRYFVHDISMSLSVSIPSMFWMRIAPVNGLYHIFSGVTLLIPITLSETMKKRFHDDNSKQTSMLDVVTLMFKEKPQNDDHISTEIPLKIAEKNFVEALELCGMSEFFSLRTFRRWVTNEEKYGVHFATQALVGLTPPDISHKLDEQFIQASMEYMNALPRKFLDNKSPVEAQKENKHEPPILEGDIYSREKYVEILSMAMGAMHDNEFIVASELYEEAIQTMLDDRIPFVDVFRVYANAGICSCAIEGEGYFGLELLQAALRINPQYDFAQKAYDRHMPNVIYNKKYARRGYKRLVQSFHLIALDRARRKYQKSVFGKYEQFLKSIGVSLNYTAFRVATPTIIQHGPKVGRNEPCPCNSGKKYKKCCGI